MPDLIAEIVMGSFVVVAGLLFLCHACYARSSHPSTHRIFCFLLLGGWWQASLRWPAVRRLGVSGFLLLGGVVPGVASLACCAEGMVVWWLSAVRRVGDGGAAKYRTVRKAAQTPNGPCVQSRRRSTHGTQT